jgi:glutamate synthase (NADPH/NADH) large chain
MTGGTVVVLGQTGRNFAAGMSGGVAYVLDADGDFARRCNTAMVELEPVERSAARDAAARPARHLGRIDEDLLHELLEKHFRFTGSFRAREILATWDTICRKFVRVMPSEYRRVLQATREETVADAQPVKLAA